MEKLLRCPFCSSTPEVESYPTLIRIFCPVCARFNRTVAVFGDGHYSEWARQQKADKNGIVTISSELNPVSDTEAFNKLAEIWNCRGLSLPPSNISQDGVNKQVVKS